MVEYTFHPLNLVHMRFRIQVWRDPSQSHLDFVSNPASKLPSHFTAFYNIGSCYSVNCR